MVLSRVSEQLKFVFIALTALISINLWSFQVIDEKIYNALEALAIFCIFLIVAYNSFILKRKLIFKSNVLFFMLLPAVSAFAAYTFHDQPLSLSFLMLRVNLFWLFYFVLHIFNISAEKIIKLMIAIGAVWIFVTIVQQLTYPVYFFYTRSESDTYSIYRSGVYRFMILGQQYGMFLLAFFFYKYLLTKKLNYLLFAGLGLIGFYYYGTRQFAASALACMALAMFLVKGSAKLNAVIAISIGGVVLLLFKDYLFAQYIEMTNEQLQYGDNVRQLAADFFLNEYWPHWAAKIFGNGPAHFDSDYGYEMELIRDTFHFFRVDVGIIGAYNEFGILYAINIIWVNLKGLQNKYYTYNNRYLKLLFVNALILLILSEYYSKALGIPFYCLIFYLADKSFDEKNEAKNSLELKSLHPEI
jgi:hypothetical protein